MRQLQPSHLDKQNKHVLNDLGFTLIEVIVVTAIIGILVTIMAMTMGNRGPRLQLKSDARDLISSMQLARVSAIRDSLPWAIQFDPANQEYVLYSSSGEPFGTTPDWSDGDEVVYRTVGLGKGVSMGTNQGVRPGITTAAPADGVSFSANRVVFNSNGTSESGNAYFTIVSGDTFAVSSLSTTGRVKAWKNYGSGWVE